MSASKRVDQIAGHLNYPKGMLAGQVAIITGSGQGIGAECARLFANEGAKVVVADVDASTYSRALVLDFWIAQAYIFKADLMDDSKLTNHREGRNGSLLNQIERRPGHRSDRRRSRRCLHQDAHPEGGRLWQRQDPHHRQQCRLHMGRRDSQDDGQAMAHHRRPARDRALQDCARCGTVLPRQRWRATEHYQHLEYEWVARKRGADQLRVGKGGCYGCHQDNR